MNHVVFILENDPAERQALREVVSGLGCLAVTPGSASQAEALLRNGAACDLIIVSTDSMEDDPRRFDQLLASTAPFPPVVVYGLDPAAKLVLHCLNMGARDFLGKPFDKKDLIHTIENILDSAEDDGDCSTDTIRASSPVANWIELTSTSELEQLRRIQRFSDLLFASNLPHEMVEDLEMAIEEVGRNAVEWGNRFDPDKRVHVSYCMFTDKVVIKVEDEGDGFVPQNLPDPTADPVKTMKDRANAGKRPGGYGVYLLRKLVDDIVYNEKGNTVLLIKYLPMKTSASGRHRRLARSVRKKKAGA